MLVTFLKEKINGKIALHLYLFPMTHREKKIYENKKIKRKNYLLQTPVTFPLCKIFHSYTACIFLAMSGISASWSAIVLKINLLFSALAGY